MNEGIKMYAKKNVITTEEACYILGRTRQQLNNLINSNRIEVFIRTTNGNLFWRPDVYKLLREINHEMIRQQHKILGYTTDDSIKEFHALSLESHAVKQVFVFFSHRDAILKNFYNSEAEIENMLIPVQGARCVIIDELDREYWFDGLTCGYRGQGPRGTESVLKEIGVDISNESLSEIIAGNEWLYFYRVDETWFYEGGGAINDNSFSGEDFVGVEEKFFKFNSHLVLAQSAPYKEVIGDVQEPSKEVLLKSLYFIPNPTHIEFLDKDEALNTGHYSSYFGRTIIYQVIIHDVSERELWLQYPLSVLPVEEQRNMRDLMSLLGVKFEHEERSLPERLITWLKKKPRSIYHNYNIKGTNNRI